MHRRLADARSLTRSGRRRRRRRPEPSSLARRGARLMPVVYGSQRPGHQVAWGSVRQFLVSAETGATAVSVIPSEWQLGYGPAPHQHEHEEVFLFLAGAGEGGVGDELMPALAQADLVRQTVCL